MRVTIGWLYPDSLSTYGDRGNVLALVQRSRWRGLEASVLRIGEGDDMPERVDVFFVGGGQDKAQSRVAADLVRRQGARLRELVGGGRALLAICGGYQLLCHEYVTQLGSSIPGVGIFDAVTIAGNGRLIGNVELTTSWGRVFGFENHSGRTYPAGGTMAMGRVVSGYGNNGEDATEGLIAGNALGSYLHGALLPRNPAITDWLLTQAIARRSPGFELDPLPNDVEFSTHRAGRLMSP
jgi:CobQ-like glutamine amidotransferase family enzyme